MNTITATSSGILSTDPLVMEIKAEAMRADRKARETVTSFKKLGELLIQLKQRVPHGAFMTEVETLTGIPHRSASRYMGMVYEKPSRAKLKDASAETYIRKCLDVQVVVENENGQVANLPPSPASSKTPLPIGAVYQDAEIVEPEAQESTAEPLGDIADEPQVKAEAPAQEPKQDHLLDVLETLPHLTQEQLQSLIKIIQTRWLR